MNKLKTLTCPSAGMYLYGCVSLCGMVFPISGLDIPVFILWFCLWVQVFFFNIKFSESLHIMLLNMSFLVSGFVYCVLYPLVVCGCVWTTQPNCQDFWRNCGHLASAEGTRAMCLRSRPQDEAILARSFSGTQAI